MLQPGTLIDQRYRLAARLGEGTFGDVWRADDARLSSRAVAVKFLKAEFLGHAEAVSRFESEADALAQVQHPNVVGVLDRGRWGDTHFLVTEFVEGHPLTAWLEGQRARAELPALATVLSLFDQMCAGIAAAHAVRSPGAIVHRDIKPDNVLVRWLPDGEALVKIVDFGIAQLGQRTGTRTGALMGTPLYMAPEQALGNTAGVGPWTDVFALGVVLVEMLTLRAQVDPGEPWWGTALQRGGDVRALLETLRRDVPPATWDVIAMALRARGQERPADAAALRTALRGMRTADPSVPVVAFAPMAAFPVSEWAPPPTMPLSSGAVPNFPPLEVDRTVLSVPPPVAGTTTAPLSHAATLVPRSTRSLGMLAGIGVLALGFGSIVVLGLGRSAAPTERPAASAAPLPATPVAAVVVTSPTPPLAAERIPIAHPVEGDRVLRDFFRRWSNAVLVGRGANPLDEFYAGAVQFRGSGGLADAAAVARYFAAAAQHGESFSIDWSRSGWDQEEVTSPDIGRACARVPGATGAIVKVRAWATEVSPNRLGVTGGAVPCDRLEGVYLFRLRRVAGEMRICHETWSLRDGVCASCPAARACQGRTNVAPPAAAECIYASHSVFHLRDTPVESTEGAEEIVTNPRIAVLRGGGLRRGSEGMFNVRFLDGTDREGWMFIPLHELGAGCPQP